MPMLRYPVGDFAPELGCSKETWHGLPALGILQGRVMDRVFGLSGRAYVGTFWTLTMRSMGVVHFRIRQPQPGHLHVIYVSSDMNTDFESRLQEKLKHDFHLRLQQVDSIPELQNAKQRIVETFIMEGTQDCDDI
ncbi:MAG: hypothetical protein GYA55_04495 [SAR324 cluster bacterium]|uniref:Uncharacterized protein n=1 Tax=SAR324 cluster bacterium TaxID=2024889 RepID=A0A7X9FQM9_9DELT|nr:hypothetical protein [SAR324 cluster bacterium]